MILSQWWARILVTVLIGIVGVSAVALLDLGPYGSMVAFFGLMTSALILIEVSRPGGSIHSSGLGLTKASPVHFSYGIVVGVGSLGFIAVAAITMQAEFVSDSSGVAGGAVFFLIAASAGEEILFRGTIFEALRERLGGVWTVAITSVLFGAAHAMNPGASFMAVLNVTLAGVLLGTMAVRTRSLWMPIAFHATWNLCTKMFFGSVSGSSDVGMITSLDTSNVAESLVWLVDGPFGIEQGLVATIVIVGATIATIGWIPTDRMVRAARLQRGRVIQALKRS